MMVECYKRLRFVSGTLKLNLNQNCRQAKRMMVECYKRLRTEDAAPGSAMSYRITVRQLEALVRLSEALARLRCSEVITPAHVREVRARRGGLFHLLI